MVSEFITACLEESTLLDEDGKFVETPSTQVGSRLTVYRRICTLIPIKPVGATGDLSKFVSFVFVYLQGEALVALSVLSYRIVNRYRLME